MGDMLSQEEIDALLSGGSNSSVDNSANAGGSDELSSQEMDALGEIGNISMGTSATTLYALLGQKVIITTPQVDVCSWEEVYQQFSTGYVAVKVEYTEGLYGVNLLLLKENDAKIITDLMMGGDGSNTDGELTDLHLSAIGEAMNQMIGSAATSMSSIFEKKVDISPPKAFCMSFDENSESVFYPGDKMVKVAFKMVIGQLVDSEIMQLLPLDFAKSLVENLMNSNAGGKSQSENNNVSSQKNEPQGQNLSQQQQYPQQQYPQQQHYQSHQEMDQQYYGPNPQTRIKDPVNVQAAQFQSFDDGMVSFEKRNIGLIMDVPLQVTVELGRTNKKIRDILELGPGSIIELDKLAGEPVDILVNGKAIAKGEVVVIDESFGVRITDIIHPSKRL
ncbi:flagellar motor switch phosphatase FliY [Acetivibrio clariflavus]|uniref:Flagellar motor switch protein FliN n=1 Tax=Acetivibrio clariflavus (strain DSM 19732 / NBRC 101661 / EBR45) TaxID=720554 RepID=G8LVG6_ACECE|nr:flagellar motor switch phosphatase FliY [Acetivibrio clariflavus]AEV68555.1 flagellar motor switch protein FliN [Acetivibrio clariflavus DSM 19732]